MPRTTPTNVAIQAWFRGRSMVYRLPTSRRCMLRSTSLDLCCFFTVGAWLVIVWSRAVVKSLGIACGVCTFLAEIGCRSVISIVRDTLSCVVSNKLNYGLPHLHMSTTTVRKYSRRAYDTSSRRSETSSSKCLEIPVRGIINTTQNVGISAHLHQVAIPV